ncbi:MAG: serine/threonine-protein kinase [Labilithrix sp.]
MRRNEDLPVPLGAVLEQKYRVERVIGRGGMGVVYEGTQLALDRVVAVKVMRPSLSADADAVARFDREARATSNLTSRHVTKILDVGRSNEGDPYFVMERLTGTTLQALLTKNGPMPPDQVVSVALDVIDALKEAHAAGIIHRDLKPANVFLGAYTKVLDFGIAKVDPGLGEGGLTTTGTMLGTPEFMAPEQLDTKRGVTVKSDVWALGVTMYYALTKNTPFEADSFYELSIKVYAHEPTPITKHRHDLPPELVAVIDGCLQKDAKKRLTLEDLAARLSLLPRARVVVPDGMEHVPLESGPTLDATPVDTSPTSKDDAPTILATPRAPLAVAGSGPVDAIPMRVLEPSPVAAPAPARLDTAKLVAAGGAAMLVLGLVFLYLKLRAPAPPPPEPTTTASSVEVEAMPVAEDPPVVAAAPAPADRPAPSSKSAHPGPRRRPVAPKPSNGALTHER